MLQPSRHLHLVPADEADPISPESDDVVVDALVDLLALLTAEARALQQAVEVLGATAREAGTATPFAGPTAPAAGQ